MVSRPATTPATACHMISVTPIAMIDDCPMLSSDSDDWLRIAARS